MSQTRTFSVAADTTTNDTGSGQGCGQSKHLYVGLIGSTNYDSFIKFTLDWSGVAKIVSATLNLYTDEYNTLGLAGEPGLFPAPGPADIPTAFIYRLTTAFTEGNNVDGHFDSSDYTNPSFTTSGGTSHPLMPLGPDLLHTIDITDIVRAWAPSTVQGGGKAANHGIGLFGTKRASQKWSGWSNQHAGGGGAAERPSITLVYELGSTVPDFPSNLTPSGTVPSLDTFEGDFTDIKPTDTLQSTKMEVYDNSHPSTCSASTDLITYTAHGLLPGDIIYFSDLGTGTGLTFGPKYVIQSGWTKNDFKVSLTAGGAAINITANDSVDWTRLLAEVTKVASETERATAHFVIPKPTRDREPSTGTPSGGFHRVIPWPLTGRTYRWRAMVKDQEGKWSAWSPLTSFVLSNTPPAAPTLTPASGFSTRKLALVKFRGGTFSDVDGDKLLAHQIQLSPFPEGDIRWDDDSDAISWDSGKVFAPTGATSWIDFYGGRALTAGTYYWRARQWDSRDGVSNWAYAQIILTEDFNPDPADYDNVQVDFKAPWRILIREIAFTATGGNITGNASTDTFTSASVNGMPVGCRVRFTSLAGGAGLSLDKTYFVLASVPQSNTTFRLSETLNGTPVDFTTNVTAATIKATITRGPGDIVAVLEEAKNIGASLVYNSPGEVHFTLLKDDQQISVIEPKQVHYAVEFYSGDGWQEKFAGVVWDVDATDVDVIFKGIDYLALYDTVVDERYDPNKPNKAYTAGGSFYSNVTIRTIIMDQLNRAKALQNSWVNFISLGSVATMDEKVTVYSTMQPALSFISGLIDSHRQGTGKRSRIKVVKTSAGGYQLQIVDDPGQQRNDLALYYGELVQGYRVIVFGEGWSNVQHVIGRNRDGAKVVYQTIAGKPFQPSASIYGRIATVAVMDGVQDQNDLTRRGLQAAIQSAKLGKNVAMGIRTLFLTPLQGWDICDIFPVKIDDGAINTDSFGSGLWAAYAVAWEATDIGQQSLIITLMPKEDSVAPDVDLIPTRPLSTQDEWQFAWAPPGAFPGVPGVIVPRREYHYDQSTGTTYRRTSGPVLVATITGTA